MKSALLSILSLKKIHLWFVAISYLRVFDVVEVYVCMFFYFVLRRTTPRARCLFARFRSTPPLKHCGLALNPMVILKKVCGKSILCAFPNGVTNRFFVVLRSCRGV
jgi:hypothetical protein